MRILSQHRCLFVVEHWGAVSAVLLSALLLSAVLITVPIVEGQVEEKPTKYTLTVLHDFGAPSDGVNPLDGNLVQDSADNLYGTTVKGGSNDQGTVYEWTADGAEKILYRFQGGTDGFWPSSGLVRDATGAFYGTTSFGGTECAPIGCGVVYKLDASGHETVLHRFTGPDGFEPEGTLVRDAAGNLYGTARFYGHFSKSNCPSNYGCGTAFKLSSNGVFKVLHKFTGGHADGALPRGLIQDPSGNLYGTSENGGGGSFTACQNTGPPPGCGTIFKIDTAGHETVLHRFLKLSEGVLPHAALLMDSQGTLYGTTLYGGVTQASCSSGCGTVYKLDKTGKFTVLHAFHGQEGSVSAAQLIMDASGQLYGTTTSGGAYGRGTAFAADSTKPGPLIWVFSFTQDVAEPSNSETPVLLGTDGSIYGTTFNGGGWNVGTLFKLTQQ